MASTIKVNNIQNQCGANIINESANTITIGASGDTVTLASGASQSGFGRTGTVDWDTTPKTASFTAANGEGYFINSASSAITVTLPASPSAGNIVAVSDYNNTAETNKVTIARNGSNINGSAANLEISKNSTAVELVYVDSTTGWQSVATANTTDILNPFIVATGGTITTCGDFKIHTFTGPGTFTVTNAGAPSGSDTVSYVVVAGGGGSGGSRHHIQQGGGGGAGGFRESRASTDTYTASPLNATSGPTYNLPVTAQGYPITVGGGGNQGGAGGGAGLPVGPQAASGSNSVFSTITSAGGGYGGQPGSCCVFPGVGANGGSGGAGGGGNGTQAGGSGNTPPVSPPQGGDGGPGQSAGPTSGGSGGGATGNGSTAPSSGSTGPGANTGGTGATSSITGSPVARSTGGNWGQYCGPTYNPASNATANTGDGAPANNASAPGNMPTSPPSNVDTYWRGRNGGSGIVIIRYKYQ